jgi:hypothetical protein
MDPFKYLDEMRLVEGIWGMPLKKEVLVNRILFHLTSIPLTIAYLVFLIRITLFFPALFQIFTYVICGMFAVVIVLVVVSDYRLVMALQQERDVQFIKKRIAKCRKAAKGFLLTGIFIILLVAFTISVGVPPELWFVWLVVAMYLVEVPLTLRLLPLLNSVDTYDSALPENGIPLEGGAVTTTLPGFQLEDEGEFVQ